MDIYEHVFSLLPQERRLRDRVYTSTVVDTKYCLQCNAKEREREREREMSINNGA